MFVHAAIHQRLDADPPAPVRVLPHEVVVRTSAGKTETWHPSNLRRATGRAKDAVGAWEGDEGLSATAWTGAGKARELSR